MTNFISIKDFKKWVIEKDLENEAIEACLWVISNLKETFPDEYKEMFKKGIELEKLSIKIDSVSMTISDWADEDYNRLFIVIRLNIEYDGSTIGEHKSFFDSETGEKYDDRFEIY